MEVWRKNSTEKLELRGIFGGKTDRVTRVRIQSKWERNEEMKNAKRNKENEIQHN